MEELFGLILVLGVFAVIFWVISIFIGWTSVIFLVAALISTTAFMLKDFSSKKKHALDTIAASFVFGTWVLAFSLYLTDVLNPVHPGYTFLLTSCFTLLPLLLAWSLFDNKPLLRFTVFIVIAGAGAYGTFIFPVLSNDYYRYINFEKTLAPAISKMHTAKMDNNFIQIDYPALIVERRERTPNEYVRYSEFNEQLGSAFNLARNSDEIDTIIYLSFHYKISGSYSVYSHGTHTGNADSHQQVCDIIIHSPRQNLNYLYKTLEGPTPDKPSDTLDTWGDPVPDQDVMQELELLIKDTASGRS